MSERHVVDARFHGTAVDVESTLAPDATDAERYAHAIESADIDARLLVGPFASNVWGGRYRVDGLAGAGAQGATFTGTDIKTGARVALKLFDLGRAKDWKSSQLFDREVQTLRGLSHPGVPQFLDVVTDESTQARALVMTLVPGETLASVLAREGPMSEARVWRMLVDGAEVLAALHGHSTPIVHRDVKPSNLMLRPDGGLSLVDFGGVGFARGAAGSTVVGTFGYMAPEQLYGAQTPSTDLYALGATALTLATGVEPEDQPRAGLAVDVDAAAPGLSPSLRALLKRLLAPEPGARPADARALKVELASLARGDTTRTSPPPALNGVELTPDMADHMVWLRLFFAKSPPWLILVVGQILLPVLLTITAAFVPLPVRRQLNAMRDHVEDTARNARQRRLLARPARPVDAVWTPGSYETGAFADRKNQREARRAWKAERRAERDANREAWRNQREQWKAQAKAVQRELKAELKKRSRERFWM